MCVCVCVCVCVYVWMCVEEQSVSFSFSLSSKLMVSLLISTSYFFVFDRSQSFYCTCPLISFSKGSSSPSWCSVHLPVFPFVEMCQLFHILYSVKSVSWHQTDRLIFFPFLFFRACRSVDGKCGKFPMNRFENPVVPQAGIRK